MKYGLAIRQEKQMREKMHESESGKFTLDGDEAALVVDEEGNWALAMPEIHPDSYVNENHLFLSKIFILIERMDDFKSFIEKEFSFIEANNH